MAPRWFVGLSLCALWNAPPLQAASPEALAGFMKKHCVECHDKEAPEGGLDLSAFKPDFAAGDGLARGVKIFDRIQTGEMPPKASPRPDAAETAALLAGLKADLVEAERKRLGGAGRTAVRRLTKAEYENTIRDLFDMPGIALQGGLPSDGSAHGFDKNDDALDVSHVNIAKYVEAADRTLDMAIATQPEPPTSKLQRISLAKYVGHILGNGDAVLLKDMKPDPEYPPAADQHHIDEGAHQRIGAFDRGSTVGIFRHEDESFHPYYQEFTALYPGRYRIRTSFWSFHWDKGTVLPARGVEAARLSAVQLTADGRGGGHPSYVLGYFDAPSLTPKVHEFTTWLNTKETLGFNTASLAMAVNYSRKGRAMAFTGPGIANDWLDVEGPIHEVWPPKAHTALFGDLKLVEFKAADHPGVRAPKRTLLRQSVVHAKNQPDKVLGLFTVHSEQPLVDADRLLAAFLPRAFRRPVSAEVRGAYTALVDARLKVGDCFETAMRSAYRAALISPDFLYHVEGSPDLPSPDGPAAEKPAAAGTRAPRVDDHALACRLSYFFWNSMPDERLTKLADAGTLHRPDVLRAETERLLSDPKSQRFVEDFLGQWLKLRQIASTDPDKKLYPEFSPYLQDSMVAETRAFFRELLEKDLSATHLVRSDFAMLNEKLAVHYGIPGVSGSQIRRVQLPAGNPRGPFLTQAALLKITANGTTTSPVPRGAFVMARLLGQEPDPPPANVAAIEPDVRGASTIREQLDKHRSNTVCASCHAKMDPAGFALESFDVIGGWRDRYRSIGEGDNAPRGSIDPFIGISFKLGPKVDPSGVLPDERTFKDVSELQAILAADPSRLLSNLAQQFAIYGAGRPLGFADRDAVSAITSEVQKRGGGVRTLLHAVVQSELFQAK